MQKHSFGAVIDSQVEDKQTYMVALYNVRLRYVRFGSVACKFGIPLQTFHTISQGLTSNLRSRAGGDEALAKQGPGYLSVNTIFQVRPKDRETS